MTADSLLTRHRVKPCRRCGTARREVDHAQMGARMRAIRERRWLSLRQVAKAMDHSPAFVSDLELGRRQWDVDKVARYLAACHGNGSGQ